MKKLGGALLGLAVGLLNGLFGAGGGMVAVPMLKKAGLEPKDAHATSIAITMPLSVFSGYLYLQAGGLALSDALPFIPAGVIGALVGALLLKKASNTLLRRLFGALVIVAAVRLLMR